MAQRVQVGERAPDFSLPAQSGEVVRLRDRLGERVVVLYFYPKDDSRSCTAEACAFRDSFEVFLDAGAEVIGVSANSASSHAAFAAKNDLPFPLLSDRGGTIRKRYGVGLLGLTPGRVTYVIDREGIVRHVFSSPTNVVRHVEEAVEVVRRLQGERPI